MPWIAPIASAERLEPLTIRFGDYTPPPRLLPTLDSLRTRAIFHAACHGIGCSGAYQLEQRFSFGDAPNATPTEWSQTRNRLFDRWKVGKSPISERARRKGPSAPAIDRLKWFDSMTPLTGQVRRMALWRNLDPLPLTTEQLDKSRCLPGELSNAERGLWGLQMRTMSGQFVRNARWGLEKASSRWHFMDILWQVMRASYDWSDSTPYGLAYLIWLDAKPMVARDPVFGSICEPLYSIAASRFSCVRLSDAKVFAEVVLRMEGAALNLVVDRERLTIEVPSNAILHVYEHLRKSWNPEDNCA